MLSYSRYTWIFTIVILIISWNSTLRVNPYKNVKIEPLFRKQLNNLTQELGNFKALCAQRATVSSLKAAFMASRISYKRAAVLIEYFYPYERKLLNGPDLKRSEDDNPEHVMDPHGLQVIERVLYGNFNKASYILLEDEINKLQQIITSFKSQTNLSYKFKNELVFDALRAAIIKMIAQGITGFDSPIALNSIPEAAATLDAVQSISSLYTANKLPGKQEKINQLIISAKSYLIANNHFNSFDRLYFITRYANPLYQQIVETAIATGSTLPSERRPLNQYAKNIFSANVFDISFFSPNTRYQMTKERVALGASLFYDSILSGAINRSCATCHKPELAFTDGLPTALSVDGKTMVERNTPTLWNAALQTHYFMDSRAATLENQLNAVVHNSKEMKGSLKGSIVKLENDKKYATLFHEAYPLDKDPITEYNISNAVSSYIRSLVALNSKFDKYIRGENIALSSSEKNGFNLFSGKAKCATCHYMPLFNGLVPPEFTETESEVLGVPKSKDSLHAELDPDEGKYLFTRSVVHKYAFKTPTLRNIALTAPYMHNGVFSTLEEVMDFYNKGGGYGLKIAPTTQTLPAEKLGLSKKEIKDIIAFMKTLTNTNIQ